MKQYLMAIDAGTGSVRAVIFDTEGRQLAVAQREWEHVQDARYPGSMGFDWQHNWTLAKVCIQEAVKTAGIAAEQIAAISTTSMREGIVLYDGQGKEIWACANVDARSDEEVAQLIQQDPAFEKTVYARSGQTYALGALPRLLWVKNKEPEIYAQTRHMSMLNDWLIYKLCGKITAEPSNACTSGIYDLQRRDWDASLARQLGLKDDIFPPTYECGREVAHVSEEAARDCGLSVNTLLVAGGGDAQLGCIGVGVVSDRQAAVFGGSFWQYELNTKRCAVDKDCKLRVNCHAVEDMWQYEAIAFMPGLAMRWYRDSFCSEEKTKAKELGVSAYALLNREAEKIPAGCYGMMCSFSDVMNYISWRHAAPSFLNFAFDAEKFNKYTFYRAIMENAALVTRGHLDLVEKSTGIRPQSIVFAGGASQSDLWCQILADTLNIPVQVPCVREATALGAAILAGYGAGLYPNLEEAVAHIAKVEKEYWPDAVNAAAYEELYHRWRKVYEKQLELADQKLTNHMWAAPGI